MRIERIEKTSDTYKDKDKSAFITENMTGSASSFIRTHYIASTSNSSHAVKRRPNLTARHS